MTDLYQQPAAHFKSSDEFISIVLPFEQLTSVSCNLGHVVDAGVPFTSNKVTLPLSQLS